MWPNIAVFDEESPETEPNLKHNKKVFDEIEALILKFHLLLGKTLVEMYRSR